MVAETEDHVARVFEKEGWIFSLGIEILGGIPEAVPDHDAVFVSEFEKGLLSALAEPVADDVDAGFLLELEVGFEVSARNVFHGVPYPSCRHGRQYGRH